MIEKERLEELIKQGATIYNVCYSEVFEEKLTSSHFVGVADDEVSLMQRYNGYERDLVDYIKCLYETKEEANWVAEFGDIERTERLELPTWEEFISNTNGIEFNRINGDKIRFHKLSGDKVFTMYDKNGKIHFEREWFLTKENYTLACRKAKELFLGGSDGDIR